MSGSGLLDAARAAGGPIQQAVAVFMLNPETFAERIAAGHENPFAGYTTGCGGAPGEATGGTVSSIFIRHLRAHLHSCRSELRRCHLDAG